MVAFGLVLTASLVPVWADDPQDSEKEQVKRRVQQFRESIDWYQVFSTRDSKEPMKPETILRWTNPTRLQKGETALILWADGGRPEALASVYPWKGHLTYEFVSLARGEGLNASEGLFPVWSPAAPGVTFRDVPAAPIPAKTAAARLTQMRAIAEPFKVIMTSMKDGLPDREEMRLLPKPIYRYDPAQLKATHPELIDGAMFAFAQGTDPEAILMVEALQRGERTIWQYAFGRATGWTVEARLGTSVIWTAVDQPSWSDPKSPAIALGRPLVD
jgi:hypothetical protein